MDKLIINKDILKAISVDSRLNILKLLYKRKYTLSELSHILKLSPSTLKEHLDILCGAKLIKKEDSSRKWKYYSLTFKGLNIINPNQTKTLVSFILSLTITIGLLALFVNSSLIGMTSRNVVLNNYDQSLESKAFNKYVVDKNIFYESMTVTNSYSEIPENDIFVNREFDVNWQIILNWSLIIFSLVTICLGIYFIMQKKLKINN